MSKKEINKIDIGLGVGAAGACLNLAYPSMLSTITPILSLSTPVVACGTGLIGCGYGIYKILTKNKRLAKKLYEDNRVKWDLFWENNKIMKQDMKPRFIYDLYRDNNRVIAFDLPCGVYKSDIDKVQQKIKEELEIDNLKINVKEGKLYLNIPSLNQEQKDWLEFWEYSDVKSRKGEYPELISKTETPFGFIYKFKSPIGLSTHHLKSMDIAIKEFVGFEDISFKIQDGYMYMEVITQELPENVPYSLNTGIFLDDLVVELGVDKKNNQVTLNLDKSPNLLIAGCTGSGKSVCSNLILTQILCRRNDVDFYLVDLKRTEFGMYKNLEKVIKYTKDKEEAWDFIKELRDECDRRSELFDKVDAKKLSEYNNRVPKSEQLNRIVLMIDDTVRLISNNNLQKDLADLGFICRSAGITIICNIQRPSAKLMSPDFKASLTNVIGFKTVNGTNSKIICDDTCLSKLRGKGNGILFNDECENGRVEFQSFYLKDYEIKRYLNKYCIKK